MSSSHDCFLVPIEYEKSLKTFYYDAFKELLLGKKNPLITFIENNYVKGTNDKEVEAIKKIILKNKSNLTYTNVFIKSESLRLFLTSF